MSTCNCKDNLPRTVCVCQPKPVLDLTKPLEHCSGKPFFLLSSKARGIRPIVGYVGDAQGHSGMSYYHLDGTYLPGSYVNDYIRNVPPPKKRVTVYLFKTIGTVQQDIFSCSSAAPNKNLFLDQPSKYTLLGQAEIEYQE